MNSWVLLAGGLVLLLSGGSLLVRGASALARSLGISPLVIGLTVLAFGTSAPELAVNVAAALKDRSDITFGNVIGSNIANIGLILGVTALISPLRIHRSILTREIPVMLLVTFGTIALASDALWGSVSVVGRMDGWLLLVAFVVFLILTTRNALRDGTEDQLLQEAETEEQQHRPMSTMLAVALTVAGLGGVLLGSHWTVEGAAGAAASLGISQAVIGLTIIALGTSLPELTTSLFAALKGHADLAMGNVVGSNVFNLLFILGVSSTLNPVKVPPGGGQDLALLAVFSLLLLPFSMHQRRLNRVEGLVLLLGYLGYIAWRTLLGPA
jgi:cation:H+ antiporter